MDGLEKRPAHCIKNHCHTGRTPHTPRVSQSSLPSWGPGQNYHHPEAQRGAVPCPGHTSRKRQSYKLKM